MNAATLILLGLFILFVLMLFLFEKGKADEKMIALIATLGALSALGRIMMVSIPSVQPTTFLVMISGYIFGLRAGFLVGASAALFSNFYLGQGPWTLWQMFSWGLAGATGGLLAILLEPRGREEEPLAGRGKRWIFTVSCMLWGYLYGWIMNIWVVITQGEYVTWGSILAVYAKSVAYDSAHAMGNLFFAGLFAPRFAKILSRYRRKLIVSRCFTKEGR